MKNNKITIGIFGYGCVASGLIHILDTELKDDVILKKIVVKDNQKERNEHKNIISFDKNDILKDDEIDVVIELINSSDDAYSIVKEALASNKAVISANKKMLSIHLNELLDLSKKNKQLFLYEASVGGSIPILRTLENHFKNEEISKFRAIINGTCNYILTKSNDGVKYEKALKEAQSLGFAESNPSLDVEGFDSKYKLSLLIKHTFGAYFNPQQLLHYGINNLNENDIKYATKNNKRIKLLAFSEKIGNKVIAYALPHFVDESDEFYTISNELNSVVLEGKYSGKQQFIGKGAGSLPTASAVYADLNEIIYKIKNNIYSENFKIDDLVLDNDYFIDIFISGASKSQLEKIKFEYKFEQKEDNNYSYILGKVSINELITFINKKIDNVFIAKLSEKHSLELNNSIKEAKEHTI